MKIAISIPALNADNLTEMVDFVTHADRLGVDCVWSYEAWGQDAVAPLAYLAARTERIALGTGIMQITARVPAMAAMTAMTLDALCGGRFRLGLGVSGPLVVEGLHGASYEAPLSRLREYVDLVRRAMRLDKLTAEGRHYVLPRPDGEGRALRLNFPAAREIPIYLATLGTRSLEYTGAAADGWMCTTFCPDSPDAHLAPLRRGAERAGRTLADLDLHAHVYVAVTDHVEELVAARKQAHAFSLGAMGSASTNFYLDAVSRSGYADDARAIQALWLDGKRDAAAARVPDKLVHAFNVIGDAGFVRGRIEDYARAGIDCLHLRYESGGAVDRMRQLEQICDIAGSVTAASA